MALFDSMLQQTVAKELVRYAVGHAIDCPHCKDVMDCSEAVLLTDDSDHTVVMCAKCYGRPIGSFRMASVQVWDGRDLFRAAFQKRAKRKDNRLPSTREWRYAEVSA